jgi:hypothetical protein
LVVIEADDCQHQRRCCNQQSRPDRDSVTRTSPADARFPVRAYVPPDALEPLVGRSDARAGDAEQPHSRIRIVGLVASS